METHAPAEVGEAELADVESATASDVMASAARMVFIRAPCRCVESVDSMSIAVQSFRNKVLA